MIAEKILTRQKKLIIIPNILLFSVKIHGDIDHEKAMDDFVSVMKNSLRQSDVLTRYGKNQVLLILLKATSIDIEVVTERIMMNWDAVGESEHCTVSYEADSLK